MDKNASFAFLCAAAVVLALALGHATERPGQLSMQSDMIAPVTYSSIE
ncbi:MAG: hypothetical protein M9924_00295 [Rhizobiaceae bacterium]|nr:hypothetical protein [Rhizobiaceae bacterium]